MAREPQVEDPCSNVSFEVSIFEIALSMLAVASLILFSTLSLLVYSETSLMISSISLISLREEFECFDRNLLVLRSH